MKVWTLLCCAAVMVILAACGPKEQTVGKTGAVAMDEPEYVSVQHILIAFKGSTDKKSVTRTKEDAETLALEVFERAKAGENFDELVEQYTDDSAPGVYGVVNHGGKPDPAMSIYARKDMVKSFGDVGFSLEPNEIGLARYHPDDSKFGWHIIKRIR